MQTIAEVLKKIEDYSISNWAEFQNPLYGFKVGAVNNRLMHIFGYLPLAPRC